MTSEMAGTAQADVLRWMEDAPAVFEGVRHLLRERSQFKVVAEAAQMECERLQQQCEALREEVRRVQAETERIRAERAETAQWFTAMIKETAARLRIEPPSA
jgi:molecular chaperone GrpE (heat shock protein)